MDNKKIPVVVALVVVALVALLWSMQSTFHVGEKPPPHGVPKEALERYKQISAHNK